MGIKDEIDPNLPIVKTFRALPDVTSVGFEWKTPEDTTNIDGYVIYRENKKKEFKSIAFIKNAFSTHYYDDKLEPQTEYTYAIAAVGKDSKVSRKSAPLKVKTSFIDPVSFVYASQDYAQKIKIFWSPSPNPIVKNYIIERQEKQGKFVAIGSTTNRMLVEFFDRNVENGVEHTYRIIAQSHEGAKSVPSQLVVGRTRALPPIVAGIKTTQNKMHAIWLEWDKSESKDVIGYNIYVSDTPDNNYRKLAFVTRESYIDKIDSHGAIRYYKISAIDKYKLESNLQESGVGGQTLPPPMPPILTKGAIESTSAIITWEKASDGRALNCMVYRSGSDGTRDKFNQEQNTSFIDKSIKEGISYTYHVTCMDKNGIESSRSRQVVLQLAPQPVAPNIPSLQPVPQSLPTAKQDSIKK
ncbi:fibronectin type III domain-containing protein [Helicobacter trogontum]|nr:fibronectin type III domain-containing protein [Helicobacter trogontum]TLD98275.1 fibronectin type III domain-containing protein [Helicobacter trogontum]